jgi:hypothetical protein
MTRKTETRRNKWLREDVTAMLKNRKVDYDRPDDDEQFAQDLITVIRERTLEEISSVVRERLGRF